MMRLFFIIFFILVGFPVQGSILKIASGEYIPYSGEKIPKQGLSTMVVRAVFKELKQDISIEFMPWNRAMRLVKSSAVAGSYPWNLNSERLKESYFSEAIHHYRHLVFIKKGQDFKTESSLTGKRLCVPNGWDLSIYESLIKNRKMKLVDPSTIESCFHMLALGSVDIVVMNELVGLEVQERLFGKRAPIFGTEKDYFKKVVSLHFIVSKKHPDAKKIISDFNRGLEIIKANGVYDSIISSISNCETCNQVGLL